MSSHKGRKERWYERNKYRQFYRQYTTRHRKCNFSMAVKFHYKITCRKQFNITDWRHLYSVKLSDVGFPLQSNNTCVNIKGLPCVHCRPWIKPHPASVITLSPSAEQLLVSLCTFSPLIFSFSTWVIYCYFYGHKIILLKFWANWNELNTLLSY